MSSTYMSSTCRYLGSPFIQRSGWPQVPIMDFQPPRLKRPQLGLGAEASGPPFHPLTGAEHAICGLPIVSEQETLSDGPSSSGFQARDDTQPSSFPAKRRKVDSACLSQGNTPPHSQEERLVKLDPFGQTPMGSCWTEPAMLESPSLGRHMMDLGLLLCPCSGLGWDRAEGYCHLPEPTSYDSSQPYGAEKQPYMDVPSGPRRDGLPLLEPEQYSPLQCDEAPQGMPLPGYAEHGRLASPPDSAKEALVPQDTSPLAQYPDEYMTAELHHSGAMGLASGYIQSDEQPPISQMAGYHETLSPHSASVQSIAACPRLSQLGTMMVGGVADQVPLGSWGDPSAPVQPSSFDMLLPDQRGGKRGPFRDPKLRQQTAQTRRTGSCIRCRMQRIRCESDPEDPGGVCLTCTNVANTKAGRFPCLRYKITDMKLYKPGQVPGYEWTRRWTNSITDPIQKWASSEIKIVRVSAGFSARCIELQVRRFIPQDGDKLVRTWDVQGSRRSVAIPPYALIDLEAMKTTYSSHIQDIMTDTIGHVLDCPDSLLRKTYFRAVQLMRDPATPTDSAKLLGLTLTLWVSIRLSTTSGFLVGDERLGMPGNILDDTSPDAGKTPMPPVLGAQLDLVLIHHIQTKLRREMLEILQKMVLKNKQMTWFVTYLVTLILLHNTALITGHDASYARKHGMKRRFAREDKVREYHLGANILLAHFHYCNKGMYPFSDDCKDKELRTLADLSEDELRFVVATREHVRRRRREWEQLRASGAYEHDFFFVSQLFEDNWKPQATI